MPIDAHGHTQNRGETMELGITILGDVMLNPRLTWEENVIAYRQQVEQAVNEKFLSQIEAGKNAVVVPFVGHADFASTGYITGNRMITEHRIREWFDGDDIHAVRDEISCCIGDICAREVDNIFGRKIDLDSPEGDSQICSVSSE